MKKIAFCLALAGSLSFSLPAVAGIAAAPQTSEVSTDVATKVEEAVVPDNVIDKAFVEGFEKAQATPEINYVNEEYLEAWKAEMGNAAALIKKSFTSKEDIKRVDDYLAAYESLIQKAFDLEMLNWLSDPDEPEADRSFGTGSTGGAMMAQAKLYKQATMNLIEHLQANPDYTYQYLYKGTGPDLKKLQTPQE